MKKILVIAAIVILVIALAITSTVAIYSSTNNIGDGNTITAKKFFVGAKGGEQAFVDAAIAPGETIDWDFTVTNQRNENFVTAVDMDMLITVNLTTDITNLKVELIAVNGDQETSVKTLTQADNSFTYNQGQPVFLANQAKTLNFIIRITWDGSINDEQDTANGAAADTASISVAVRGQQHVA